jgi:cell division protein FtsA
MSGTRLEALVHIVTGPSAGRQNLEKAVKRAGLEVERMMLEPLAAAESTLTDDDKEYGCALVNIGSEITGLMIFGRGAVQHTAVFPFGGLHFTKDLAVGLRVSIQDANKIKQKYGCVAGFLLDAEERQELVEIVPVGRNETRGLSKEILCDIMQPRAIELLQHVAHEVNGTQLQIPSGVVLTGGGSMVRGMVEIAGTGFRCALRVTACRRPTISVGWRDRSNHHHGPLRAASRSPQCVNKFADKMSEGDRLPSEWQEWFGNIRGKFK